MDSKKLRILFIDDDEHIELVDVLKLEGYDVEHLRDVESLEKLADGRYQVIFYDVRGIGEKYSGNGLDVLKYVSIHNPLVFNVVFSAKPFSAADNELTRQYAQRVVTKDCTAYEVMEMLEGYASEISFERIMSVLSSKVRLNLIDRWRIKNRKEFSKDQVEKIARRSGVSNDALSMVANILTIATTLLGLATG